LVQERDKYRVQETCSGCGSLRTIVNVALNLCGTCNRRRLRANVTAIRDRETVTHGLSASEKKERKRQMKAYSAWFGVMYELAFSSEDKETCKQIIRRYVRLIAADLDESEAGKEAEDGAVCVDC